MKVLGFYSLVLCMFVAKAACYKVHVSRQRGKTLATRKDFCGRSSALYSKKKDDLEALKIDISKVSEEEAERLAYIQKLTLEADEMVKAAGFRIDDDDDEEIQKSIKETKWSGQSDMEETVASSKNWDDLARRPGLAIGDAAALITFATIGRANHGENLDLVSVIYTGLPFLLSWLAVSPFLGSYSRGATATKGSALSGILAGWAVSMPLAIALRGVMKGDIPPTPFIVVSMVATLLFLSGWRFLYISLVGSTSDEEYKEAGFFEVFKMIGTLVRRW